MNVDMTDFHTIKSILNVSEKEIETRRIPYFHTIKSILNFVMVSA